MTRAKSLALCGAVLVLLPAGVLAGRDALGKAGRSAASEGGPVPVASLKELMDSTVDPAADGIWDSVAVIARKDGVENREPRTDEEWAQLRRHVITLVEASNLIALPGRRSAPAGSTPGLGELAPAEIERRISRQRVAFQGYAKVLQATAQRVLVAVDRRDKAGIMQAGGDLDEACEACHVVFWYPPAR